MDAYPQPPWARHLISPRVLGCSTMDDAVQDLRQTVTVVVGGILGHILV